MSDQDRLPETLQWYEGMLLAPQHFQQLVRRSDRLLTHHMQLSHPFHFGVIRQEDNVAQGVLAGEEYVLSGFEAIMPDGLEVYLSGPTDEALRLDLAPYKDSLAAGDALTVHLCVRRHGDGLEGRFNPISGEAVRDENPKGFEVSLRRLRPRLRVETTPDGNKDVTLPLARFRLIEGRFKADDFGAPLLVLSAQGQPGNIHGDCVRVRDELRRKITFLTGLGTELTRKLAVSLFAPLPPLEAMLASPLNRPRPYDAYLLLCHIAGQVQTLREGEPPHFNWAYDHQDSVRCFRHIRDHILRALDTIIEHYRAEVFTFISARKHFEIFLKQDWLERDDHGGYRPIVLGVRGSAGRPQAQVMRWMENCHIFSERSEEERAAMVDVRVNGAPRELVKSPIDRNIIALGGTLVWEVTLDPDYIGPDKRLEIVCVGSSTPESRPEEIVLYVPVRPEKPEAVE